MKLLFRSLETFRLGGEWAGFLGYVRAETDGSKLLVTIGYESTTAQEYSEPVTLDITYNGVTRSINEQVFGEKRSVEFPYNDSVKSLTVSGMDIYYKDKTYTDGKTFTWRTAFRSTPPTVTYTCPGARETSRHNFSWTITDPLGRPTAAAGLRDQFKKPTENFWTSGTVLAVKSTAGSVENYVASPYVSGTLMYYKFYAAVYDTEDAEREDYVELVEVTTRTYTVSTKYSPYPPYEVNYKTPVIRAPLKISWEHIEDPSYPTLRFELERSLNGGSYTLIYAGLSKSFSDTIPEGTETVEYRVHSVGARGTSVYCTGEKFDAVLSNLYVGVNGEVRLAGGLYIGVRGEVKQVTPLVTVGGA